MKYLNLTLPTPEANLACEEAILDWCEAGEGEEVLRFWESAVPFVVVGYGNAAAREAHLLVCHERAIPVLRRCSGGGTVVQGPGCLNYALVLRIDRAPALSTIPGANRFVMGKHRQVFQDLLQTEVKIRGHTDLAIEERKFSGNAQRRKRHCLLFHGTVLLDFELPLLEQLLPLPGKQPVYRGQRSHIEFLRNLHLPAETVQKALRNAWQAFEPLQDWPSAATAKFVQERYSRPEWNLRV